VVRQQFLIGRDEVFLIGRRGQFDGLFNGRHRLREPPGFSVSRRQRAQKRRVTASGQFTNPLSVTHCLRPIANGGISIGRENPGEVVDRQHRIGLQSQGLSILRDGFRGALFFL